MDAGVGNYPTSDLRGGLWPASSGQRGQRGPMRRASFTEHLHLVIAGQDHVECVHGDPGCDQVCRRAGSAIEEVADLDDPETVPPAAAGIEYPQLSPQRPPQLRAPPPISTADPDRAH